MLEIVSPIFTIWIFLIAVLSLVIDSFVAIFSIVFFDENISSSDFINEWLKKLINMAITKNANFIKLTIYLKIIFKFKIARYLKTI